MDDKTYQKLLKGKKTGSNDSAEITFKWARCGEEKNYIRYKWKVAAKVVVPLFAEFIFVWGAHKAYCVCLSHPLLYRWLKTLHRLLIEIYKSLPIKYIEVISQLK